MSWHLPAVKETLGENESKHQENVAGTCAALFLSRQHLGGKGKVIEGKVQEKGNKKSGKEERAESLYTKYNANVQNSSKDC